VKFFLAILWGSLSAQFSVQVVVSFIIALVHLSGVFFSKVSAAMNLTGALTGFAQSIMFGALFVGGNWATSKYIVDYYTWNAASIAALLAFVVTMIYVSPQVPGKVLLARMCAWVPHFMEAQMHEPRKQRVAFARKWRLEAKENRARPSVSDFP
jgi:hypothetical protein